MGEKTLMPDYYGPTFCQEGVEVIACSYVGGSECNHKCNLGRVYLYFLKKAKKDAFRDMKKDGLDTKILRMSWPEFNEPEFFGGVCHANINRRIRRIKIND